MSTCDCQTAGDRLPSVIRGSPVPGPRGDRLRILLLVRALGLGGAERQTVNLATGLARRGHKVTVATFYPGGAFESILSRESVLSGGNLAYLRLEKRGRWDV